MHINYSITLILRNFLTGFYFSGKKWKIHRLFWESRNNFTFLLKTFISFIGILPMNMNYLIWEQKTPAPIAFLMLYVSISINSNVRFFSNQQENYAKCKSKTK